METLKQISLADLRAEVLRREQEEADAALAARVERNTKFFEHRDILLQLMEHGRTSCSDDNPINGDLNPGNGRTAPRCYKCAIINLSEFELADVELDISVTVRTA